jgi:IS5 family transposase
MSFKKINKQLTFADFERAFSNRKNKSLQTLTELNNAISWDSIESTLLKDYPVGHKREGNAAYSPLLLFKCLLLQKWFRIKSDPELENLINDRDSFRAFLNFSSFDVSPDHSTFSRFRKRLTIRKFDLIISDILNQFSNKGITVNEGVSVDARIVKSASKPMSNKKLKQIRDHKSTPEGKLDKNGKPAKFSRDIESDWAIKNNKAYYGLKEHASVDTNGFILKTELSPASVHDTKYFQYCTIFSLRTSNRIKKVYADKGYHGELNRSFLSLNKFQDGIMRKNTTTAKLTTYEKERNKKISKVRYIVEQYFGLSHLHDNGQKARFTTIAKNNIDIWFRQVAFNIKRGLKLTQEMTPT